MQSRKRARKSAFLSPVFFEISHVQDTARKSKKELGRARKSKKEQERARKSKKEQERDTTEKSDGSFFQPKYARRQQVELAVFW